MRTWDRLSATFVRGVKEPGKYYDGGGLVLSADEVKNAPGTVTKAWLFRFQIDKRERWMGLGSARVVSLSEARAKANEARKLLAAGIDPIAHRDANREQARAVEARRVPFKRVLDQLIDNNSAAWREKHASQWRNSMDTYCASLMRVPVGDIDTDLVTEVLEAHWKRIPKTMDRVRRRIGEVLGFAQVRGWREQGPLPTAWENHLDQLLPHPNELQPVENHAAMGHAAVPALYSKLIASDAIPEMCLTFTILTGVRSQESRGARWDEIDLEKRIWTVPGKRMKRKKEHRVPLSDAAIALVNKVPRSGEYLFAIKKGGKHIVAMSLRKALHRHAGDEVTVHGMRSAIRDWGSEETNTPREVLEHALAHIVGEASERAYARSDMLEKRRTFMQQWADHCVGREPAVMEAAQ